jgi:peptide/nickel transport system permease protein
VPRSHAINDVTRWVIRRTVEALLTALAVVVVLIILVRLLPGDPLADILADRAADPAQRAVLEHQWGLDRSILQSIGGFFAALVHGDLGLSLSEQRPVTAVLAERLPATLLLGALTLLVDFSIGLALGVWSALHPDSMRARIVGALTLVGYALPSFVIGMLLTWIFAVKLGWLETGGMSDVLIASDAPAGAVLVDRLKHLVLPLAAMVIATIAIPLRQQRSAAMATASQPWVLAARARGVSPALVAWRHCWRPALTPVVTLFGLWLPMLVAGSVFVEIVFSWPGTGSLLAHATASRDFPLVIGAGLVLILFIQLGSLAADVLYRVVDPVQRHT